MHFYVTLKLHNCLYYIHGYCNFIIMNDANKLFEREKLNRIGKKYRENAFEYNE